MLELAIARRVQAVLVVGSAGSFTPDLPIGTAVVVTGAEREDGTSHLFRRNIDSEFEGGRAPEGRHGIDVLDSDGDAH